MINKKNKKGVMGIVFFFLILFTILILGVIGVVTIALIDYSSGIVTPIMTDIGMVGNANMSEASEVTFGTVDTLVNALPWLLTFTYVAMLIFSVIFVVAYRFNPHPAYMGIYFLFVILLIFGAILMSNMYQDMYSSGDEVIGDGLQAQQSMSFLIMHSPVILALIAFIVGIYIFTGNRNEFEGGFDL